MNADRRGPVLIGECTSDIGVHVHRNAISMCAPALPYVAGCLTVAARPAERRRRSGAFGRRRERPPLSGCLDRHRGGLACAHPCHPPHGGSLPAMDPYGLHRIWTQSIYHKRVTYLTTVLSPPLSPPGRSGFPWPFVAVNGRVSPGSPRAHAPKAERLRVGSVMFRSVPPVPNRPGVTLPSQRVGSPSYLFTRRSVKGIPSSRQGCRTRTRTDRRAATCRIVTSGMWEIS